MGDWVDSGCCWICLHLLAPSSPISRRFVASIDQPASFAPPSTATSCGDRMQAIHANNACLINPKITIFASGGAKLEELPQSRNLIALVIRIFAASIITTRSFQNAHQSMIVILKLLWSHDLTYIDEASTPETSSLFCLTVWGKPSASTLP